MSVCTKCGKRVTEEVGEGTKIGEWVKTPAKRKLNHGYEIVVETYHAKCLPPKVREVLRGWLERRG